MTKPTKPTPGSPEAYLLGCCCPILDNNHGEGYAKDAKGQPLFWVAGCCEVHNEKTEGEANGL